MDPLASTEELTEWYGEALADESRAARFLDTASAIVRRYCRLTFTLVEDDQVAFEAPHSDTLWLPERPVQEVSLVELPDGNFNWAQFDAWQLVQGSGTIPPGKLIRTDLRWWDSWQAPIPQVRVTYTHGEEDVPDDVKGVVMAMAVRAYTNRTTAEPTTYGEAPEAIGFGPDMVLFPSERALLADYRAAGGNPARSVHLGGMLEADREYSRTFLNALND